MPLYSKIPQLKGIIEERHASWLCYAFANWIVLIGLYKLLNKFHALKAVFIFKFPSSRDWLLAVLAFIIAAFIVWPITSIINNSLGIPIKGMNYDISNVKVIILVVFFAIITAPFVEEILYRGLGIGYLIARGVPPWLAGAITVIIFAVIHIPYFGFGGAIFIIFWGILPTTLRLYTNNLTPGLILHVINNIWAYIVVAFLFR